MVDSSNAELMRRAHAGQADPVLLIAEQQSAGRGRLGRAWHSPAAAGAGLTFSLGLLLAPQDWAGLSLAVGLSLVQGLDNLGAVDGVSASPPRAQLKWPNDLWVQDRKLGGILIETAPIGAQRYVVVGVGLNLVPPEAQDLRTPAAALCEWLPQVQAPQVLAAVLPPLVRSLLQFAQHGFAPLRAAFAARDALYGRAVQCSDGRTGWAHGVDDHGAFLLRTAEGIQALHSTEISVRPHTPLTD